MLAFASVVTACSDSFVYDYEGDCDPKYRVRFYYDHNLKFADAFGQEVDHVTLNVVDEQGRIVYTHRESGDELKADGYEVVLDGKLAPGNYRLQAWCGKGAEPGNASFAVHEATTLPELRCTLLPDAGRADAPAGAEGTDVHRPLDRLFHGLTDTQTFPDEEGVHTYTVPLKKNTNSVKVVLQHLSGMPIDGNDFDFTIVADNARMDHDNSILPNDKVTYHAWDIANGSAEITSEYQGMTGQFNATVAEFTIGRLMADQDVRLEARRIEDQRLVFSVNMVDLALMVRGNYNRQMDPQEYLDRQDDYNFVFFLDADYRWIDSFIYVNSWKIVFQNTAL